MTDSLDEMTVPDDWIEIINSGSQKRQQDNEDESTSPPKHWKPNNNNNVGDDKDNALKATAHSNTNSENLYDHGGKLHDSGYQTYCLNTNKFNSCNFNENKNVNDVDIGLNENQFLDLHSVQSKKVGYKVDVILNKCLGENKNSEMGFVKTDSISSFSSSQKTISLFNDSNQALDSQPENNIDDRIGEQLSETKTDDVVSMSIFEEVEAILKEIPAADANVVYNFLEVLPPNLPDRIRNTIATFKENVQFNTTPPTSSSNSGAQKLPLLKKDSTFIDDPALQNDPIFRDMRFIAKMFPDRDRNEIYALLEANISQQNRVGAVIDEFLTGGHCASKKLETKAMNQDDSNVISTSTPQLADTQNGEY